jgi:hypothetical protein
MQPMLVTRALELEILWRISTLHSTTRRQVRKPETWSPSSVLNVNWDHDDNDQRRIKYIRPERAVKSVQNVTGRFFLKFPVRCVCSVF